MMQTAEITAQSTTTDGKRQQITLRPQSSIANYEQQTKSQTIKPNKTKI